MITMHSSVALVLAITVLLLACALCAIAYIKGYNDGFHEANENARIFNDHKRAEPLRWTKENGFNRAPTLAEARQFTPPEDVAMDETEFNARLASMNGNCPTCDD